RQRNLWDAREFIPLGSPRRHSLRFLLYLKCLRVRLLIPNLERSPGMLRQQQSTSLLITITAETLSAVRRSIHACENCSNNAQVSFEHLFDRLIGRFSS